MTSEKEVQQMAIEVVNKLIVHGKLELNLKNIWVDELLNWIIDNNYTVADHELFDPLVVDCKRGIDPLFNHLKSTQAKKVIAIEQKPETFDSNFGAKGHREKIKILRFWVATGRKLKLSRQAVNWAKSLSDKEKDYIKSAKNKTFSQILDEYYAHDRRTI